MENETVDNRFSIIYTDPRFKKVPKYERKIKIDKRFQSMFTDKKFKVKYTIDKRGRPFHRSTTEDFQKFYHLPSDGSGDNENESKDENDLSESVTVSDNEEIKNSADKETDTEAQDDTDEDDSDDKVISTDDKKVLPLKKRNHLIQNAVREKLKDMSVDYARGESNLFSDSSSDETESEESDDDEVEHKWGELDNDAVYTENITSRLAVCNMDWDRIRAEDLMILFNSFLPSDGLIRSLTIYPSEYGLKRMKEEEVNGPTELVSRNEPVDDDDSGCDKSEVDEEGQSYHRECLRQYQLNRLKYYYAIVEFDSPETANKIYKECDNLEYESSAIRLDLRFVPDDVTFDQEPKERCDRLPDLSKYKPRYFTTTALQQAKVELTWDETDPSREEFAQKVTEALKSGDINDSDIENYVALSSSEEGDDKIKPDNEVLTKKNRKNDNYKQDHHRENVENDDKCEDPISAYRSLLEEIKEKENQKSDVQLEISWGPDSEKSTENSHQETVKQRNDLTPFQKLLQKTKMKRKERKKQSKLKKKTAEVANGEEGSSDEIHFGSSDDEITAADKSVEKENGNDDGEEYSDDSTKREAELELLLMDEDENNKKSHFSLKKIKEKEATRKRRKRKEKLKNSSREQTDDFQVDVKDERFQALYSSHLFNIDPTDSHFYKTKGMEAFIAEKQKRKIAASESEQDNFLIEETKKKAKLEEPSETGMTLDLTTLVRSVKNKTQLLLLGKNKKR